ncbi:hypothetical protein [Methylomagnum sp.]
MPETTSAELFGIPKEYVFLVIGLLVGLLIGFWVGFRAGRFMGAVQHLKDLRAAAGESGLSQAPQSSPPAALPGFSLVVNGDNVDISAEAMEEIQALMKSNRKIDAITILRDATGMGLAEAKAVMDSLEKVIR